MELRKATVRVIWGEHNGTTILPKCLTNGVELCDVYETDKGHGPGLKRLHIRLMRHDGS